MGGVEGGALRVRYGDDGGTSEWERSSSVLAGLVEFSCGLSYGSPGVVSSHCVVIGESNPFPRKVNGKVRAQLELSKTASEEDARALAEAIPQVRDFAGPRKLSGRPESKVVVATGQSG